VAAEYAVNIRLNAPKVKNDLKGISTEISNLESRVAKLNKSTGKNPTNKQLLKVERDKLALQLKENRLEKRNLQTKVKELQTEKSILSTRRQSTNLVPRSTGGGGRATGGGGSSAGRGGGSGALQSGLISGAFPLLFGQGALGGIAGFTGGFVGTKLGGQMGGFAGGLVATALLQTVTNTINGINELGASLNDPAENINKLILNLSRFDKGIATSIQILQSAGLTQSAGQLGRATFRDQFSVSGANSLEEMNKAFKEFSKVTSRLGTELAILASGPLTGFMKMLNFVLGGGGEITGDKSLSETLNDTIRKREKAIEQITRLETSIANKINERDNLKGIIFEPDKEKRRELNRSGVIGKAQTKFRRLGKEISEDTLQLGVLEKDIKNLKDIVRLTELQQRILKDTEIKLKDQLVIEQQRFNLTEKDLINLEQAAKVRDINFKIVKQKAEIEALAAKGSEAEKERENQKLKNLLIELQLVEQITENRLRAADPRLSRIDELNREMLTLTDSQRQAVELSKTMGTSFEEAFKGIISGTMSTNDAFRNMLNSIANHFRDTAAKILANQLQRSLLGLLGNVLGGSLINSFRGGSNIFDRPGVNSTIDNPFVLPKFADGGRPPVGRASIVGERGPELFVPDRAGTIVPNNAMGGSTNIVINVDASGSSVEGNDGQANQFGNALASAIQAELINQKRAGGLLSNQ
tara:strand:+ start:1810 stop:3903 length:2094 start_codon:yes stop_codon:yes gene_type:complete